jgi:hypothetical protein
MNVDIEEKVDAVFDKIQDFARDTSYTAKQIILESHKRGVKTSEYLDAISGWISEFEKAKEGNTDEKI